MPRRVVSLLRGGPAALGASDAVLEANAYALAVDVDLAVVLRDDWVEVAVADGRPGPRSLAGAALAPPAGGQDLRGLLESGVDVYADADDLAGRGIGADDLLDGVRPLERDRLDDLVIEAEAVINW